MAEWSKAEDLLKTWLKRASEARNGHRISGKKYLRSYWILGIILVLLSVATGTSLAANLQEYEVGRWAVRVSSALVAVLAAYQTFRRYDEIAQRHEAARAGFACVSRDIEQIIAVDCTERDEPCAELSRIRKRLDDLAHLNTPIPERVWQQSQKESG